MKTYQKVSFRVCEIERKNFERSHMQHTKINWEYSNAEVDYLPLINTVLIDTLINPSYMLFVLSSCQKLAFV